MNNVPLISEWVPRRDATFVLTVAAGSVVIVLLGALYGVSGQFAHLTTDGQVAAFDLDSEGSIASWFSITLLLCCAVAAWLVRRLRRAAGCSEAESRAWCAISLLWLFMSLDEGASLHEAFKEVVARVVGTRLWGDGSIYWAVPYFFALGSAGLYMLVASWRCRGAVAAIIAAGACYALAVAGQLDWILAGRPLLETWLEESCEMLADLLILTALGLYARSVLTTLERGTELDKSRLPTRRRALVLAARSI